MRKKTVRDIDVTGRRVLVRVDFNVPLSDEGEITDDTRIRACLPTISYLVEAGAKVILCSHMGRPKGKVVPELRLTPVATRLADLLGRPVIKAADVVGPSAQQAVAEMEAGEVVLLENVRFHPGEEANDPELARALAALADVYAGDAFGAAHRAHASTAGVARHLPAVAGLLMERELTFLGTALSRPERPFTAVIGGAKVSDKIGVLQNLVALVDHLVIGGGMANTFLRAQGHETGKSLVEQDKLELARSILDAAQEQGAAIHLPADVVVASEFAPQAEHKIVPVSAIPPDWMALDIGPESREAFAKVIVASRTVIWNGPMGVFEMESFAKGTLAVAEAMARCTGLTIVGGGDSVAALEQVGLVDAMRHVSTGGGASLEFLEGRDLSGVACLMDKEGAA